MEVVLRKIETEAVVEVVDRVGAVYAQTTFIELLDPVVGLVVFVFDLADDLLEEILEGDDPLGGSVLVDDDRKMLVRTAHFGQEGCQLLRLGQEGSRPIELTDSDSLRSVLTEDWEEIADVQDPDDLSRLSR